MSTNQIDIENLTKHYNSLPEDQKAELDALIDQRSAGRLWVPSPGPQLDAVNCKADVLLYGGEGGGGKTDLILGLAFEYHKRSLLIRKHYTDLTALTDRAKEINLTDKGYNGSLPPRLTTVNGKIIDFGGLAKDTDHKHWQGQAHDLLAIDEVVQNREAQVRFLMGWVRDASESGQRCRVVFGSNPPEDSAGDWIIPMFAPWLDPMYENPAVPGELRWVVTSVDEQGNSFDEWVDGPHVKIPNGKFDDHGKPKYLIPMSRTFIPAHLDDNPFLRETNYAANLDALQEPLRSAIRDGNFMVARKDDPDQLIPSGWIWGANNRWQDGPPQGIPMCAMGVDAARSKDQTVLAPRFDGYYPKLIVVPGKETPHGRDVAALVVKHRRHGAVPVIDCGETNGSQAYAHLIDQEIDCIKYIGMDGSVARTREKHHPFFNIRSQAYWQFMEALDPEQDGGSPIALPDDPLLRSELCAVHWELTPRGIQVTPKKEMVEILKRSPDRADAVVMSWFSGQKNITNLMEMRADQRGGMIGRKHRPQVNMGPRRRSR